MAHDAHKQYGISPWQALTDQTSRSCPPKQLDAAASDGPGRDERTPVLRVVHRDKAPAGNDATIDGVASRNADQDLPADQYSSGRREEDTSRAGRHVIRPWLDRYVFGTATALQQVWAVRTGSYANPRELHGRARQLRLVGVAWAVVRRPNHPAVGGVA